MRLIFTLFAILTCFSMSAQRGTIRIVEDTLVTKLMARHQAYNSSITKINAWAIQIMVTNDKYKAESTKLKFLTQFPDVKAEMDFEAPYFRLKVGACVTKGEANLLLQRIVPVYPEAYVVTTKIRPRDLIFADKL